MANPIQDIKRLAGISSATLRRWEKAGLLPFRPRRDAVGRRLFTDDEVEEIRRLVKQKHPAGAKAGVGK